MQAGTRRRLRTFGLFLLGGAAVGIGYGSLIGEVGWGMPLAGGAIGAVHGLAIAAAVGGLEVFGTRTPPGRLVEQAPLGLAVAVKGFICAAVIVLVETGRLGERVLGLGGEPPRGGMSFLPLSVGYSLVVTCAFIFVLAVGRIVGARTLRDIVLGRYHRPRAEERLFLFVDIVGSTAIAERLGPLAMHRFLGRVFAAAADPVADHEGEIYQYVGDQIVVTWPVRDGRVGARPLACLFALEDALAAEVPRFQREFGVVPRLRAALHGGPVVSGEVGESKRAIAFHGDVLHAAARLEQATRELGHRFLVSGEARRLVGDDGGFVFEVLGSRGLRGRSAPLEVYAVRRPT
jgi:adenylate cyclase